MKEKWSFPKTKQFEDNEEAAKMRKGMSNDELMQEWAATGDERYLTPSIMQLMGMAYDNQGKIIFPDSPSDQEFDAEVLVRWGVDIEALQARLPDEVARALLPLASRPVTSARPGEQIFSEDDRDAARRELSRFIRERPSEMIRALFEMLDPEKLESLAYLRHLEDEIRLTSRWGKTLQETGDSGSQLHHDFIRIEKAAVKESGALKKRMWDDQHGRYLVFQAIQDFASRILLTREEVDDPDLYVPFEITKGKYAAFSLDGNRIFIDDENRSAEIKELFRYGWNPEYIEHGHDAPTDKLEYVGEGLLNEWEYLIDNGRLVSEMFPAEFAKDTSLIDDYALILHTRFRAIIEEDLGFRLRDLTIREQLYFLDVAKRVPWHGRDSMKSFVAQWGIPGLRTFLAASVDEVAGEEIFKLTYRAERKAVNEIFKKFGELADKIESLESYLIEKFGHAEEGLIHEATEKLLTRGHQILKQAHDYRDNPEALEKLINSLDTEIRVFADLAPLYVKRGYELKDIVGAQTASLRGGEITGTLRAAIEKMHREGYEKDKTYSEVQIKNLEDTLRAKMEDPTTEFKIVLQSESKKPIASLRFDFTFDPKDSSKVIDIFLASVMSSDSVSGSRIGLLHTEAQIRAQMEAHGIPIRAISNPNAPITTKYLDMGFVVTGITRSSDGKPFFQIELNAERNKKLSSIRERNTADSTIAERVDHGVTVPSGKVMYIKSATPQGIIERLQQLQQGDPRWCMTRYFPTKKTPANELPLYYAVFERES